MQNRQYPKKVSGNSRLYDKSAKQTGMGCLRSF